MTDASRELVDHFGELAQEAFRLEVEKQELAQERKDEQAALDALYGRRESDLQERTEKNHAQIWRELEEHRDVLIQSGKKSFPTLSAIFKLRDPSNKYKVTDAAGVLKAARRLRIMREIADPPKGTWRLDQRKFFKWLERNPGWRHFFGEAVEDVSSQESLTIQPNGPYMMYYNNRRVSPPSVKIERKEQS